LAAASCRIIPLSCSRLYASLSLAARRPSYSGFVL
jgi:hypothetical protein